jgi:hypothetical protein
VDVDGDDHIARAQLGRQILSRVVQHRRQRPRHLIGVHGAGRHLRQMSEHPLGIASSNMDDLDSHLQASC